MTAEALTAEAGRLGDGQSWQQLPPSRWRAQLAAAVLRLVEYADLTDGGERIGLEQASLWMAPATVGTAR